MYRLPHTVGVSLIISTVIFAVLAAPVAADMVSVPASKDNTLYGNPAKSNGAGDYLFTGLTYEVFSDTLSAKRRALIKFELFSYVPFGAQIDSVRLTMYMSKSKPEFGVVDNSLHRIVKDWGEGLSDASGPEGRGANAQPGDATWNNRFFPNEDWSIPGGDFDPVASAVTGVDSIQLWEWSSPGMTADVQMWTDDPLNNFGWIIIGDETRSSAKRFNSRTFATDVAQRPRLDVYFAPVCSKEPMTLAFDTVSVGSFVERSFTLKNTAADALGGDVTLACPGYSIVAGGGPYSLAQNESLLVTVRYEPTDAGPHPCVLGTGSSLCGDVNVTAFAVFPPPIPTGLTLGFPGPNPFDTESAIAFSVDQPGAVSIAVYDVRGARVATIADGWYGRGEYLATWDGRASSGNLVSRGTYFIRATFRGDERVRKITFVTN